MANEAYFIIQRKYFHVLMKVLSFFYCFFYYMLPAGYPPHAPGLRHPCLPVYRHDLLRCELFPHRHALVCIARRKAEYNR